jgi:hypothetical protein
MGPPWGWGSCSPKEGRIRTKRGIAFNLAKPIRSGHPKGIADGHIDTKAARGDQNGVLAYRNPGPFEAIQQNHAGFAAAFGNQHGPYFCRDD